MKIGSSGGIVYIDNSTDAFATAIEDLLKNPRETGRDVAETLCREKKYTWREQAARVRRGILEYRSVRDGERSLEEPDSR